MIARKLIQVLREAGKRVPEDVSVTGFDDFEIGPEQQPALSTFRVNTDGMIDLAVNAKALGLVVHDEDRTENRTHRGGQET